MFYKFYHLRKLKLTEKQANKNIYTLRQKTKRHKGWQTSAEHVLSARRNCASKSTVQHKPNLTMPNEWWVACQFGHATVVSRARHTTWLCSSVNGSDKTCWCCDRLLHDCL